MLPGGETWKSLLLFWAGLFPESLLPLSLSEDTDTSTETAVVP